MQVSLREKKPGVVTDELRVALGMEAGGAPPWLINMQRYGPPPSYPNLKIPGLNAPIPEGATYGFHHDAKTFHYFNQIDEKTQSDVHKFHPLVEEFAIYEELQAFGKVQLIDASGERFWTGMRKSLGSKRREIPETARDQIVRLYADFLNGESGEGDVAKIFDTSDFGYREIRSSGPCACDSM